MQRTEPELERGETGALPRAEAVIRSVELIVPPGAPDVVAIRTYSSPRRGECCRQPPERPISSWPEWRDFNALVVMDRFRAFDLDQIQSPHV